MFRPRWLLVGTVVALAPACTSEAPRGVCGDGSVDPGEQCDDGDRNADGTADACRAAAYIMCAGGDT